MWELLLAVHLTGIVGYNLLLRKSLLEKVDRFKLATIMQTGIVVPLIFTLFYKVPDIGSYTSKIFLLMLAVVALTIGLHVTNTKSLQYLEASVYSVIYNLRILIATVLGIVFLDEGTHWLRILGGLLILFAIFIVRQKGSRALIRSGVVWGVSAAFVISFLNLCEKELINKVGYLGYAAPTMIAATILMWGYLLVRDRKLDYGILVKPKMLRLMFFRDLSAFGFSLALTAGALVSVSNYISSMGVILIVAAGIIFLNERDYLQRKIIATATAAAGLTIVLISTL